jgi:hypothetical protein
MEPEYRSKPSDDFGGRRPSAFALLRLSPHISLTVFFSCVRTAARAQRPCSRSAAEKRDEIALRHSITSSAAHDRLVQKIALTAIVDLADNSPRGHSWVEDQWPSRRAANSVGCFTGPPQVTQEED